MTSVPSNPFQEFSEAWASIYPLFHWILEHPIGSLLLAFGGLYLFWGLLRGLVHLTENLWIRLLKSPLWLAQQLWQLNGKKMPSLALNGKSDKASSSTQALEQLMELIDQLEEGHRHQEQLLNMAKEKLKTIEISRLKQ